MIRRIVIKLGTGVLSRPGGCRLDVGQFRRIAAEVAEQFSQGRECLLVSSAAIAAGVEVLALPERPGDLHGKQACAAAGQPALMRLYGRSFRNHDLHVAQLLLTHGDIDSRIRRDNARNTLERLLAARNIVPIINENDSVAVEELRFGDNDRLSAEVATLADADLLILLTNADGLMAGDRLLRKVTDFEDAFRHVRPDIGAQSVGGMQAKLEAARIAVLAGIPTVIAHGRKPGQIAAAIAGKPAGTRFDPEPRTARKRKT